jgi:hypothetical protein
MNWEFLNVRTEKIKYLTCKETSLFMKKKRWVTAHMKKIYYLLLPAHFFLNSWVIILQERENLMLCYVSGVTFFKSNADLVEPVSTELLVQLQDLIQIKQI